MKKIVVFGLQAISIYACSSKSGGSSADAGGQGAKVYKQYGIACHGADGKLGLNGAKDLTICTLTEEERIFQVTEGKNTMTPFKNTLTPEEIKAVVAYTFTLK